jgi:Tfp pilus assembly protein PilF
MRSTLLIRLLVSASACVLLTACGGPANITPQSPLDSAEAQYGRGLLALAEGDLRTAQTRFERARGLDDDFPGSYVGDALVAAAQEDFFRARKAIGQALHRDAKFVDAHVALGRVVTQEGMSKNRDRSDWLEESGRSFKRAAQLSPERADADFYLGQSQALAGEFEAALVSYQRVIARNRGPFVTRAMAAAERVQVIQRAAPGTHAGVRIAVQDKITRSELAVLLLEEMKLEQLVQQRRDPSARESFQPPPGGTDAAGNGSSAESAASASIVASGWARPWVMRAFELGLPGLEPLPDGSLGEDIIVTRASFARVIEGILTLLSDDQGLQTRYFGETSRFADVRADHFSYNAIALSVDRGIMRPDPVSGRFGPDRPVSGSEALLIIRELQNAVRMEF